FKIENDKITVTIIPGLVANDDYTSYYDAVNKSVVVASEFADDENLVLRQYAHHLLFKANNTFVDQEQHPWGYDAIESGLASYFPCSFSNHEWLGDKATAKAKAIEGPYNLKNNRKLNEIKIDDWVSVQLDGNEIWGGVFWEIRQSL